MAANEAKIIVIADDKASKTLTGIGEKAKSMRGAFLAVGAAGAAVTGAIGLSIKSFAQAGDEIQKMALRTGLGTEALSKLKFALEQSGSNIEGFEKGIRRMSSFIQDGRDGLTETTRALDTLGIAVSDFDGMSPEAAFDTLSTALAGVQDDLAQSALAQDIFGRSGTALLPLLKQGKDGIEALKQEAQDLGIVFDQDAANAAARLVDAQNTLSKSFQGVQFALAEGVAPALSGALEKMGVIISKVTEFAKENPVLTKTIVALAAGLGTLAIAVAGIGLVLPIMATGFGIASGASAVFTAALWAQVAAWIAANAATGGIIIAIGAVVTGIVLLIKNWDDVVRAIKIGINFMMGAVETWANFYIEAINKIIGGINKLAEVFGKEIDEITEVKFKRLNTAAEESAEVVDESSDEMGDSLEGLQLDFTETADVAEDAYKRMAQAAQDAHDIQVKEAIEASKGLSELFQRKRERDDKIAQWDKQQAENAMALAIEEAEAIVAASDKRYADIKTLREDDLERFFDVQDTKRAVAEALAEDNKAEFERLREAVFALPSVIPAGGITAGDDETAIAAILAFKASQQRVTDPALMNTAAFRGDALGAMVLESRGHVLGGAPPMIDGTAPYPVINVNVDTGGGSVVAEDLSETITKGINEAIHQGVFMGQEGL